jgi:hypothetical protein
MLAMTANLQKAFEENPQKRSFMSIKTVKQTTT